MVDFYFCFSKTSRLTCTAQLLAQANRSSLFDSRGAFSIHDGGDSAFVIQFNCKRVYNADRRPLGVFNGGLHHHVVIAEIGVNPRCIDGVIFNLFTHKITSVLLFREFVTNTVRIFALVEVDSSTF